MSRAGARGLAAVALLFCLGLTTAVVATAEESIATARSDAQWLQSIQDAAQRLNYSGTIIYQRGEEMMSSKVFHAFEANQVLERVVALDGHPREFIRRGDQVQCFYQQRHQVVFTQAATRVQFPALVSSGTDDVPAHYEMKREGQERVAGRACEMLSLVPRDGLRYGYRLWVEPLSGLLLKVQTLDDKQHALEQIYFSDLRLGEPIDPVQLRPSLSTNGWTIDRREPRPIELRQYGWLITPPTGFHRKMEVMRNRLIGGGGLEAERRPTLQAVYSDGLATVSVFIEQGAPPQPEPDQAQSRGAMSAVTRQVGDARVTVIGEVPLVTAGLFANAVVHAEPPR